MIVTNVATGLEIEGEDNLGPVTWEDWITLPVREQGESSAFLAQGPKSHLFSLVAAVKARLYSP